MSYDDMEAGRELDAMVVEKVMGVDITSGSHRVPFYSTDIAAAWEVVEKLKSSSFYIEFYIEFYINRWQCHFCHETNGGVNCRRSYAPTAPLAICRAALKAIA